MRVVPEASCADHAPWTARSLLAMITAVLGPLRTNCALLAMSSLTRRNTFRSLCTATKGGTGVVRTRLSVAEMVRHSPGAQGRRVAGGVYGPATLSETDIAIFVRYSDVAALRGEADRPADAT